MGTGLGGGLEDESEGEDRKYSREMGVRYVPIEAGDSEARAGGLRSSSEAILLADCCLIDCVGGGGSACVSDSIT